VTNAATQLAATVWPGVSLHRRSRRLKWSALPEKIETPRLNRRAETNTISNRGTAKIARAVSQPYGFLSV